MGLQQFSTTTSLGGIPNIGVRNVVTTGNVYFVDSNTGADTNSGLQTTAPLATLGAALALCASNKGDVVVLMPAHVETITGAATDISVEGVRIVGLGEGDNRPQFTFGTDTTASFNFNADNITIENVIFKNNVDSQAAVLTIPKAYGKVIDCEFWEGSSKQYLIGISLNNAASDNCKILNCKFVSTAAGAASAIKIGAALDNLEIAGCTVFGDFSDACIHNPTGNVATNLNIHHNYLQNTQTGDHSIELVSACTGFLAYNLYHNDMTQATGVDPGSCASFECYHDDTIDVSGILAPAAT